MNRLQRAKSWLYDHFKPLRRQEIQTLISAKDKRISELRSECIKAAQGVFMRRLRQARYYNVDGHPPRYLFLCDCAMCIPAGVFNTEDQWVPWSSELVQLETEAHTVQSALGATLTLYFAVCPLCSGVHIGISDGLDFKTCGAYEQHEADAEE